MLQALVPLALALVPTVTAQAVDQASCTNSAWIWSWNSLDQDPCHVAQALGNQCSSLGDLSVPTLPAGYYYSGEDPQHATDCTCNTVYYSLLSVCGQCQNGYALPWGTWNANCTRVYQQSFPRSLPSGFNVPDWAYNALLSGGTVDFAAAKNDKNPESTAPVSQSGTGVPTATAASSGSSSKKVNIGAIVGGTVGGVVFLVLLALSIWLLCRKRKPQQPTSAASNNDVYAGQLPMLSEKPYNPNDPSTYVNQLPASPPITPGPPIYADRNSMSTPYFPGVPMPQQFQENVQMPGIMMMPQQQQWQVQQVQMPHPHPQSNGNPVPEV